MLVAKAVEVATNNMIIEAKIRLHISPENEPLLVVCSNKYSGEVEIETIEQAKEFAIPFLTDVYTDTTKNIIRNPVVDYFGKVMETQAQQVSQQLDGAVSVTVEIIE